MMVHELEKELEGYVAWAEIAIVIDGKELEFTVNHDYDAQRNQIKLIPKEFGQTSLLPKGGA
jgi:hypothetical protein